MAYIGNTQLNQNYVPAVDFFSGNGSTTAFTLSRPVASVAAIQATISNVPQDPGTAFTVSGSTITFTSAPPSGTNNIYVYYTSPNTQVVQPGQGTVGTTQLADGSVTPAKLSTGSPSWDTSSNLTVGGTIQGLQVFQSSSGADLVLNANGANRDVFLRVNGTTVATAQGSTNNFQFNSGYGSVATAYGCRAWVNFNGTGTVAIRASGNVSSITDNGTGDYTVNFATAMPDANYAFNGAVQYVNTGARTYQNIVFDMWDGAGYVSSTGLRFSTSTLGSSTTYDCAVCTVSIFR